MPHLSRVPNAPNVPNEPNAPNARSQPQPPNGRDQPWIRHWSHWLQRRSVPMGLVLWLTVLAGIQLTIAPIASIAEAAPLTCRLHEGREVCIDRIKRSAKHYWEYRVWLTIDGVPQPEDRLDCRYFQHIDRDGFIEPFTHNDPGHLVCDYFNRRTWR